MGDEDEGDAERFLQRFQLFLHVLAQLEADHRDALDRPTIKTPGASDTSGQYQLTLFGIADHPLLEQIQKLEVDSMTPLEAMQFLQQAKTELKAKLPS